MKIGPATCSCSTHSKKSYSAFSVSEYFVCEVFFCRRFGNFFIELLTSRFIKPLEKGCYYCEDKNFCTKKQNKINTRYGFKRNSKLKHQILLFNEEGITTEVRIGRFLFKVKGKNESN